MPAVAFDFWCIAYNVRLLFAGLEVGACHQFCKHANGEQLYGGDNQYHSQSQQGAIADVFAEKKFDEA